MTLDIVLYLIGAAVMSVIVVTWWRTVVCLDRLLAEMRHG